MDKTLKIKPVIIMALLFAFAFTGCEIEPAETTYTVWTDVVTYSEYQSLFGTLSNGYYIRYQFTSAEWNAISPSLTSEDRFKWTESQIKKWFIGRGFGNYEANQETAWFITINHGFIAERTGSLVNMILK